MTSQDKSLLYRVGLVNQRRPEPPRSVRFENDTLAWDKPSETGNVSHYIIRVGTDQATVKYKVPVGTTAIRPSSSDSDFFISSWNETMGSESTRVAIEGQPPDLGGPLNPPGHVTNLVAACGSITEFRGQKRVVISATFNAPSEVDFNGFDGVEYFHRNADGEIIKDGWIPLNIPAGAETTVEYEIDAPVDEETQTIYIVSRSGEVVADYETAPDAEVVVVAGGGGILGDVTVAGSASKTWLASGDLRVTALRTGGAGYLPPYLKGSTEVGEFLGVDLFWERGSDPENPYSAGSPPYTGNPAGTGTARYGEINVVIPRGFVAAGTHYLILRSYGKSQRLGWKRHDLLPLSTYFVLQVTAQEIIDNPSDGTTPGAPTSVTPFIKPGRTAAMYYPGVRFSPPASPGGTVGYAHHYRFWKESGMTNLHYPTDGTWIEAGFVQGASLVEIVGDEAPRDSETVYMQAGVAPFNERWEQGSYVNSATTVAVTPAGEAVAGQNASVAITIEPGADSRSYYVAATLTPPDPLGGATQWRAQLGFFDAETSGAQTHPYTPLGGNLEIYDTTENFGPFTRGVDEAPWAALIVQLIYADGSTSGWISAARKQVAKQAAPTPTMVNESTVEYETISGKPSYRINKKVTFSGSKDAVDWTDMVALFYTNSGGTTLDGEVPLGGLDPRLDQTWPITVEQKTDWWDRPDYAVWYKIGVRAKNSDGAWGSWVYTTLTAMTASAGFDAGGANPSTLSDRLLIDGSGKLSAYALTELAKWGISSSDFESSDGYLVIKAAVIERLLAQSVTITSDLTITRSSSGGVVAVNGNGVEVSKGAVKVSVEASQIKFTDGTNNAYIYASSGKYYMWIDAIAFGAAGPTAAAMGQNFFVQPDSSALVNLGDDTNQEIWRAALGVAKKQAITPGTIPLAKITAGGTDGSFTVNAAGQVTAYTAPT